MRIDLGGIPVELRPPAGALGVWARSRYAIFSTNAEAEFVLAMRCIRGGGKGRPHAPATGPVAISRSNGGEQAGSVVVSMAGRRVDIRRSDNPFEAVVDLDAGRVEARVTDNPYCIDGLLRCVSSSILALRGGALFHALGVRGPNGLGYLLLGRSGAGKSTLSALAPERCVLSDELVAVRRDSDDLRLSSTPFWGEFAPPRASGSAKLAGVYLLRRDSFDCVAPVPMAAAAAEAASCALFFGPAAAADRVLGLCVDIARRVGIRALHFRRSGHAMHFLGEGGNDLVA